ncbi:glycosyltransferase [Flavobacterium luteum]|uniref:Glycosyltransferase n=1 Tax=Flavobacterium luteum TaxID=2026654 RepID=A0A7J5AB52_9FLAO|nr:glycosyltransferase [Flavobacterium luteum]KAB1154770.1 glycosyltransferase [Flavobacterium luteum]
MNVNKSKNILLLVTHDYGGGGEFVHKIARIFKNQGHKVVMLVKKKTKEEEYILEFSSPPVKRKSLYTKFLEKTFRRKKKLRLDSKYHFYSKNETLITIDPEKVISAIGFTPDYIFSGWTADFMNSSDLLLLQKHSNAQVYTITIDMNHFTGGCHFAWDCKQYSNGGCTEKCPAIKSPYFKEIAKINFETKLKNAREGNFKIISGSDWVKKQALSSMIYKNQDQILNINSLIDTTIMKPKGKIKAKEFFNLDENKFYILVGATYDNELRKGFNYFLESLKILFQELDTIERSRINILMISSNSNNKKVFKEIPFGIKHLGYIKDYNILSLLYQAVDVYVNSSIEDSGPMMVSEALACGTPVVGFDMGIVNSMVINRYNGYRAILKDSKDLANGIKIVYRLSPEDYENYSKNAVSQVQKLSSFEYGTSVLQTLFE